MCVCVRVCVCVCVCVCVLLLFLQIIPDPKQSKKYFKKQKDPEGEKEEL